MVALDLVTAGTVSEMRSEICEAIASLVTDTVVAKAVQMTQCDTRRVSDC